MALCSIDEAHGKVHAKGLCMLCYSREYERKRSEHIHETKKALIKAKQPNDDLESIVKRLDTIKDKSVVSRARYIIEQYLFHPKRVAPVVQAFFNKALINEKVLLEYMKILVPRSDQISPVQVIINAPSITNKSGVTYDITGEEVISDPTMEKVVMSKV